MLVIFLSLAARLDTIRVIVALEAFYEWEFHHLDVKLAFLNGKILEEIYVQQPEGYEVLVKNIDFIY